ncbi:hypothetical protein [Micromonospora sp. NPDC047730]|uniref:hypothetical protein n=1 Tax=Micromonospora sp. NPDC047730 TaxID=3364253 RepID=UPI00372170BF
MIETTSATTDWRAHAPVWGEPLSGEEHASRSIRACAACCWAKSPTDYSVYAFARHTADVGAPDYMVTYWKSWASIVEGAGQIDRDAVARELSDYSMVMDGASTVYSELAGLSKPNTAPGWILQGAEEKYREIHADLILNDLLPQLADEESRRLVIAYAESLQEGAWEQHQESQRIMERLRATAGTER